MNILSKAFKYLLNPTTAKPINAQHPKPQALKIPNCKRKVVSRTGLAPIRSRFIAQLPGPEINEHLRASGSLQFAAKELRSS